MIALTAGRRGWSDALVLKPSQCIRPPYRARSTFMQRSITTERPPASAIRASSVVDAMHWAQRHRLQEGRSRVEKQPLAPARHPSSRRRPSARHDTRSASTHDDVQGFPSSLTGRLAVELLVQLAAVRQRADYAPHVRMSLDSDRRPLGPVRQLAPGQALAGVGAILLRVSERACVRAGGDARNAEQRSASRDPRPRDGAWVERWRL